MFCGLRDIFFLGKLSWWISRKDLLILAGLKGLYDGKEQGGAIGLINLNRPGGVFESRWTHRPLLNNSISSCIE
jgi:hypothetical protein